MDTDGYIESVLGFSLWLLNQLKNKQWEREGEGEMYGKE